MKTRQIELRRPGLHWFYGRLLARPLIPAVLLALMTALSLWQATNLRVAVDLSGLIGAQTPGARAIRDYADRFEPFRAEEVLLVSAPGFGNAETLRAFEDLVLELQFVDGVESVISIAGLPAPGRSGAWLSGPELAALPPAERLRTMRDQNPLAAQLMSRDLTRAVVVVNPSREHGGAGFLADLMQAADRIDGLRIDNVGLAEVQRAVSTELIRDLEVLTPASFGISLILTLILFRSIRAVLAVALPPVVGLIWFMGWMGATGTAIDPVMGALPVLLIVLAFSDSIHVYHAAIHLSETGDDPRTVVAHAMAETAPAAALTSLTTIIAFASLSLPDSPSLNTMSLAGVAGMTLSLTAVLLLTPILMWAMGSPKPGSRAPRMFNLVVPPARALARRGRLVAGLTALLLVGLLAMQSQSRIGFRYADYLPRGADVSNALADMEAAGLGSDRMIVIVESDPAAPLERVRRAVAAIWGEGRTAWVQGDAGAAILARMAARDGAAHALPVQMPIAAADVRADEALRALEANLETAGLAPFTAVIGPGYALLTEGPKLVQNLRLGLYGTIAAITLLVALVYRSWRLGLLSLVVNLIPILGVEAWLVLIGRELTIMNVIALTIAFGIAVDDTLHFLNRLRLAPPGDTRARVTSALVEAGPPITATTVILLSGLVVTLTSALPGLAVYGGLMGLAVLLALLTVLFLLPGLIRWSVK